MPGTKREDPGRADLVNCPVLIAAVLMFTSFIYEPLKQACQAAV